MSENDQTEGTPEFIEALGVFIGAATREDVIALGTLPPASMLIARIEDRDGTVTWARGHPLHLLVAEDAGEVEDDPPEFGEVDVVGDVIVITGPRYTEALGFGYMSRDVPLVLSVGRHEDRFDADLYSGGVRIKGAFGQTITLAVWHTILHVTEDGDVAPGFGSFTAESEEDDD